MDFLKRHSLGIDRHPDRERHRHRMILALIASGLTLIFGIMDVVEFRARRAVSCRRLVGVLVLSTTGSFWLALILATLLVGLFGAAMQIVRCGPLIGRDPLTTILATFGVRLFCRTTRCGSSVPVARRSTKPSTGHSTCSISNYPWYGLVIAGLSAAIIGGFWLFLNTANTASGSAPPRRTASWRRPWASGALGHTAAFAIGAGMAAASGVLFGRWSVSTTPWGRLGCSRRSSWWCRRHGQSRRLDAAAIFISLLESYASIWMSRRSGDRVVHRADPDAAVPADGLSSDPK